MIKSELSIITLSDRCFASDRNPKISFQDSATVSSNIMSNIHYFEIASLSFKIRTKIGEVKLANWQNEQNEMVKLANWQNEQNEMVKLANWQNEQNETVKLANWQNEQVKLANWQNEQSEKCLC